MEYKKSKDRVKGVAAHYKRCGYESYLMVNTEAIVLYYIMRIILSRQRLG